MHLSEEGTLFTNIVKGEVDPMFSEYLSLLGFRELAGLDYDSISRAAVIIFCGLLLALGGYILKGPGGAFIAILIGAFLFFYGKMLLPL